MKYLLEKAEMKPQLAGFNVVWRDFASSTDLESLKEIMTTMDRIVDANTGDVVFYGTQRNLFQLKFKISDEGQLRNVGII